VKVNITTRYQCELCGEQYDTEGDAFSCEKRGLEKAITKVGDIVTCQSGFGWFDGDPEWISNPEVAMDGVPRPGGVSIGTRNPKHGNCFGKCCTYQFYYVVSAIDYEEHRVRYHVVTKAMSGAQGYRSGYTYNDGHCRPVVVKSPPALAVDDVIGHKAESLL
jgi:hypothetical protein